jgi:hypothetical protein
MHGGSEWAQSYVGSETTAAGEEILCRTLMTRKCTSTDSDDPQMHLYLIPYSVFLSSKRGFLFCDRTCKTCFEVAEVKYWFMYEVLLDILFHQETNTPSVL